MNKPPPFKGLDIRIPIIIPIQGRGFINHGSGFNFVAGTEFAALGLCRQLLPGGSIGVYFGSRPHPLAVCNRGHIKGFTLLYPQYYRTQYARHIHIELSSGFGFAA